MTVHSGDGVPEYTPTAGNPHSISCVAVKEYIGISMQPTFTWSKDGSYITSGDDGITLETVASSEFVTTNTLTFDSLKTSHAGVYMCEVSLSSPALSNPLTYQSDILVQVYCELTRHAVDLRDLLYYITSLYAINKGRREERK